MLQRSIEHPARVTRVEGDLIVAHYDQPTDSSDEFTVWAPASLLFDYEGLIAKPAGQDHARVLSVPFYRIGVCLDDVVRIAAEEETGAMVVVAVSQRSDFANFVLRLTDSSESEGVPGWRRLMMELEGTGTWFDPMNAEQIAAAVPLGSVDTVASMLARLKSDGLIRHWGRFDTPSTEFLDELEPIFLD